MIVGLSWYRISEAMPPWKGNPGARIVLFVRSENRMLPMSRRKSSGSSAAIRIMLATWCGTDLS